MKEYPVKIYEFLLSVFEQNPHSQDSERLGKNRVSYVFMHFLSSDETSIVSVVWKLIVRCLYWVWAFPCYVFEFVLCWENIMSASMFCQGFENFLWLCLRFSGDALKFSWQFDFLEML